MWVDIVQWIDHAWSKVTIKMIVNNWNSVGQKAGDQEDKADIDAIRVLGVVGG
jgi:hypothetical protein